jgi:hypothetical protein
MDKGFSPPKAGAGNPLHRCVSRVVSEVRSVSEPSPTT